MIRAALSTRADSAAFLCIVCRTPAYSALRRCARAVSCSLRAAVRRPGLSSRFFSVCVGVFRHGSSVCGADRTGVISRHARCMVRFRRSRKTPPRTRHPLRFALCRDALRRVGAALRALHRRRISAVHSAFTALRARRRRVRRQPSRAWHPQALSRRKTDAAQTLADRCRHRRKAPHTAAFQIKLL